MNKLRSIPSKIKSDSVFDDSADDFPDEFDDGRNPPEGGSLVKLIAIIAFACTVCILATKFYLESAAEDGVTSNKLSLPAADTLGGSVSAPAGDVASTAAETISTVSPFESMTKDERLQGLLSQVDLMVEQGIPAEAIQVDYSKIENAVEKSADDSEALDDGIVLNEALIVEINGSLDSLTSTQTILTERISIAEMALKANTKKLEQGEAAQKQMAQDLASNRVQAAELKRSIVAIEQSLKALQLDAQNWKQVEARTNTPQVSQQNANSARPTVSSTKTKVASSADSGQISQPEPAEAQIVTLKDVVIVMASKNAIAITTPNGKTSVLILGQSYDGLGTITEIDQAQRIAYGMDQKRQRWKILPKARG